MPADPDALWIEARYVCTADAPWVPDKPTPAAHPDVVEVEDSKYRCPHCGVSFDWDNVED